MSAEAHPLEEASGPVNAECVIDYTNELRTSTCAVCGAKEVREKSIGRGLKTVVKCQDCGYEYFTRGE